MKKAIKYLIVVVSMAVLIYAYFYVLFWSGKWRWKFWVSGDLGDLIYLTGFTLVWGSLIKALWKLEVRLLF